MRTVYNLEYKVIDKLGRGKAFFHVGVFNTPEAVDLAKHKIMAEQHDKPITFDVYAIEII